MSKNLVSPVTIFKVVAVDELLAAVVAAAVVVPAAAAVVAIAGAGVAVGVSPQATRRTPKSNETKSRDRDFRMNLSSFEIKFCRKKPENGNRKITTLTYNVRLKVSFRNLY